MMESGFPEDLPHDKFPSPIEYVSATVENKLKVLRDKLTKEKIECDMVICADTVCVNKGKIIEKPVLLAF
jgi:predicted house-cleaning NTP pyrophosphatase (Maf/HAM1 superfamily)